MISTIAESFGPFARAETPIDDDIENAAVPDFDDFPRNVGESMATDALSKEERRLFADGERTKMTELSPIDLSLLPAETSLLLHGEAHLGGAEALCCASSQSGPFLAAGCRNGATEIYRVPETLGSAQETAQLHPVYEIQPEDPTSPVTSVAWLCPAQDDTKYVLASAQARAVHIHHVTTQKLLASAYLPGNGGLISSTPSESILTVAPSPNSGQEMLATGGSDGSLTLFDRSLTNGRTLRVGGSQSGGGAARAHSNRVVALEWHPNDANLLFSGGWDLTVKMWDVRLNNPVMTIEGPYLCGQGISAHPERSTLATSSWRADHPLQLWDLRTGKLQTNLPVSRSHASTGRAVPKAKAGPQKHTPELHTPDDGSPRLFCVVWMAADTLICGGSGSSGGVTAVNTDGSSIGALPGCGVGMDVCLINPSTGCGPMAAVATSAGLSVYGPSPDES